MENSNQQQEEVLQEAPSTPEKKEKRNFGKIFITSLLYSLTSILKFLLLPWELWKKAVLSMTEQNEKNVLNFENINNPWPFLTFLKRFIIDFLLDALSVLSWIIVPILAIVDAIDFGDFESFILGLLTAYVTPVAFMIVRDIIQLLLIPFRKFLSWGSKPAQYLKMDMNKIKEDK